MNVNKALLITGCCFLIALCLVFNRDLSNEKAGAPDLRNRIVGARLQKDGKLPYFYRWQKGAPVRYYDVSNIGDSGVSNITSSPFFHTLLYPIADLRQRTISQIWLLLEYLFILITGMLAYRLTGNNTQKIIVISTFILFLFTEAWKVHIAAGQTYILLSLLAMVIYFCLTRPEKLTAPFIAGLAAIVVVLIRPNFIVFFLPFLFLANTYSRKYLAVLIIPVILLPAVYFSFENNRNYWKDYFAGIPESIKMHQTDPFGDKKVVVKVPDSAKLKEWEGWDTAEIAKHEKATNLVLHSENGNVYVIYLLLFKKQMSVGLMSLLSGLSIIAILLLYLLIHKKYGLKTLPNIALLGYCLYMIVDLFSPICRNQYYATQWLFPLLIAALVYKPANKWFYAGLLLGLILNIINNDYIKMEHTIGEYLILFVLLCLCLTRKLTVIPLSHPLR
jgi:hypothetical protein